MFKEFNLKTKIYIIFIYAISIFLIINIYFDYYPNFKINLYNLIIFTILAIITESMHVLFNNISFNTSFTIALASILLFGPIFAIIITSLGAAFRIYKKDNKLCCILNVPIYKTLFNMSIMIISSALSSKVFDYLGGNYYDFYRSFIPILGLAFTFLIVNYSLIYFLIHLMSGERFIALIANNISMGFLNTIAMLPLGVMTAMGFRQFNYLGVIVVFGPILLARYSFMLYAEMKNSYMDTVRALSMAVEAKDRYTEGHSSRVVEYAEKIGTAMRFTENHLENLKIASLLHDIGKIGIPEAILNKPGRLSDEEYNVIKTHPVIGANIIKDVSNLKNVVNIVKYHHERYDGTGYPEGLKGDAIPIEAAIISVADAYDAMCSDRPYRKAMPKEKAVSILKEEKGRQFNPKVVDVFLKILSRQSN